MKLIKLKLTYKTTSLYVLNNNIETADKNILLTYLEFKNNGEDIGNLEFNPCKDPRIVYSSSLGYHGFRLEPGSDLSQEIYFDNDSEIIDEVTVAWLPIPFTENDYHLEFTRQINKIPETILQTIKAEKEDEIVFTNFKFSKK